MMNPIVKAKWVAALRSGEYEQGIGQLRLGNTFCCLGVLCDIYAKESETVWESRNPPSLGEVCYSFLSAYGLPPQEVVIWAELDLREPVLTYGLETGVELTTLNDDLMLDFKQIADLIEDQL